MKTVKTRKFRNQDKGFLLRFLQTKRAALTAAAQEGYATNGRGHLMVIAREGAGSPYPAGTAWYVNEEANATLPDPDEGLEQMVRDYDPTTHSVVVVYMGRWYKTCLVKNVPLREVAALAA